jgi:hypothetical protein
MDKLQSSARTLRVEPEDIWSDEQIEWSRMTPQERWAESMKLWEEYLALGGSLDPEPDPQSPFYGPGDPDTYADPTAPKVEVRYRGRT